MITGFSKKLLFVFASLMIVSLFMGCASRSQLKRADALAASGRYEDAIALYEQIINLAPDSDDARKAQLEIGNIYFKKKNEIDKGLEIYQKTAERYPQTEEGAEALWNIAGYHYKKKDYDKAIEVFSQIAEKFSKTSRAGNAQYMVARCYETKADELEQQGANTEDIEAMYTKAMEEYGKVAEMFPEHSQVPMALRNKASLQEKLNLVDDAAETYKQIVKNFSESPESKAAVTEATRKLEEMGISVEELTQNTATQSRVNLRQAMQERRRAQREERMLRDIPEDQRDRVMGRTDSGSGSPIGQSDDSPKFQTSFKTDPDALMREIGFTVDGQGEVYDAIYMVANMYYDAGNYDAAGALLEKAISLGLKQPRAFIRLAMCYKHEGMEEQGKKMLADAARKDPKIIDEMITSGRLRYDNEEYDKALEAFSQLVGLVPTKDADVYYNIGITYKAMKEYDKAIDAFEKSVASRPSFQDPLQHLAELYYYNKKDKELGLIYQDAAGDKSYSYEPQKALGDLCYKHGKYTWARLKYNTAARLAPSPEQKTVMEAMAAVSSAKAGDIEKARTEIATIVQQNPESGVAYYAQAELALVEGNTDAAIAGFKKALEADPSLSYAAAALGDLYLSQGNQDAAKELWNNFLNANPKDRIIAGKLSALTKAEQTGEAEGGAESAAQ